jgi:hypothetical protein
MMGNQIMKQVVIGTQYTVEVMQGGLKGKCVYAKYGYTSTDEAEMEIDRMKFKYQADGVDTADYLYVIRPVDQCDWVYDEDYIQELREHALKLWEKGYAHCAEGKEYFVDGFIEGVTAQQEERV